MLSQWWPFVIAAASLSASRATDIEPSFEVRTGKTVTTGKLLAKGKDQATLLDRTGRLHDIDLKASTLKPLDTSFQSLPATEHRNQLLREFGNGFEAGSSRHFLVLAPQGRASTYAAVFQQQFATMLRYFKTRGFTLSEPQFPLVAIVFPNRQQFIDYAQADGAKGMSNMLGYYSPRSNRVALFETRTKTVANQAVPNSEFAIRHDDFTSGLRPSPSALFSTQGDLQATLIHEATHQIAYNIGLHSRLGETPRWVIEGMATAFEPQGMRDGLTGATVKQRINRDRFLGFQNFASSRRQPKSLKSFIEADALFQSAPDDFYSQSWALTFFLIETRPRNYSAFVKRIAARDAFADYPGAERLADFKEAFQADIDWLDAQFLRFINGLK